MQSDVATTRYQQHHQYQHEQHLLDFSPMAPTTQSSPTTHTHTNTITSYSQHHSTPAAMIDESLMDPFFAQMSPQNWVSPAAMPWDGWDFLMTEGPGAEGQHS